ADNVGLAGRTDGNGRDIPFELLDGIGVVVHLPVPVQAHGHLPGDEGVTQSGESARRRDDMHLVQAGQPGNGLHGRRLVDDAALVVGGNDSTARTLNQFEDAAVAVIDVEPVLGNVV